MKIITEPTILMIGETIMSEGVPDRLAEMGFCPQGDFSEAEVLAEIAGRNCYQSWENKGGKTNQEYLAHILGVGHLSVLEHASVTFFIEGVSRSLTHEMVRHRHLSPSQLSQRYVDESETDFVIPPAWIDKPTLEEAFKMDCTRLLTGYESYMEYLSGVEPFASMKAGTEKRKAMRESARCILPNATETKLVMTGNFRAWRWFLKLRGARAADREIRRLAVEIGRQLVLHSPNVFGDFKTLRDEHGVDYLETEHPY